MLVGVAVTRDALGVARVRARELHLALMTPDADGPAIEAPELVRLVAPLAGNPTRVGACVDRSHGAVAAGAGGSDLRRIVAMRRVTRDAR